MKYDHYFMEEEAEMRVRDILLKHPKNKILENLMVLGRGNPRLTVNHALALLASLLEDRRTESENDPLS